MLASVPAARADHYWDGGGTNDWWSTVNNWDPNSAPTAATIAHNSIGGNMLVSAAGGTCRTLYVGDGATNAIVFYVNGPFNVATDAHLGVVGYPGWTLGMVFAQSAWNIGGNLSVGDGSTGNWILTLKATADLVVSNTATIRTGGTVNVGGGVLSVGNLVKSGGAFNYTSGVFRLTSANLEIATDGIFGAACTFDPGKTVEVAQATTIAAGGSLTLSGGELTSGSFDSSTGTWTHSAGRLTVREGTFRTGTARLTINGAGTPEVVLDGATALDPFGSGATIGNDQPGRLVVSGGTALSIGGIDAALGLVSGGQGSVVVTGTGTSYDCDYMLVGQQGSGEWRVEAGATATVGECWAGVYASGVGSVTASGTGTLLAAGNMAIGGQMGMAGGSGTLTVSNGAAVTVSSILRLYAGDGVNLRGGALAAGTIDHTRNGFFTFTGGTLSPGLFQGSLTNRGGTLAPGGSPGTTIITRDYDMDGASTLAMEIGGTVQGSQYDHLTVSGAVTLAGALNVSFCNGHIPDPGETYNLLDWGSLGGAFDTTNLPALPPGRGWDASGLYTDGRLSIVAEGDAADMLVVSNGVIPDGSVMPSVTNGTDFGNVEIDSGSVTHTLTITNNGAAALTVYGLGLSGAAAADFTAGGAPFPALVAAGGATNFMLTFDPSASGLRSATVCITNDAIGKNPYTFAVQGRGAALPGVETAPVSNIAPESAECGGVVTSDGGLTVGLRGCCWNTSGSPTPADDHTEDGGGTGTFVSTLTNLTGGALYCVRAYATNELGIAYGSQVWFRAWMHGAGRALQFDGINDYVQVPHADAIKPTNALTVSAWVFKTNWIVSASQKILSLNQSGGYALVAPSNRTLRGEIYVNGSYLQPTFYSAGLAGGWHHVALTYDGRYARLHVDGELRDTRDAGGDHPITYHPTNSLILGAEASAGPAADGNYFQGILDETRIWNRACTEDELRDDMHRHLVGTEAGLEAYYDFDQIAGTNVDDRTGNGHTGLGINWPGWTDSIVPFADIIAGRANLRGVWLARTNSLSSSILSVSNAAVTGLNYRVFGHNGGALTNDAPDKPDATMWRLNRAWQFEGGGSVTGGLLIDCSSIVGLITDTNHLRLLVDTDGSFTNASLFAGVYAGGVFRAAGQAPQHGSWYTLGELAMLAITATAGEHGMINPSGAVAVVYSGATNFAITPDTYWHVGDVTTNGGSVGAVTAFTWSNVVADGAIHATFAADETPGGTPHWWLAQYGLTNGGATFDAAETNNPDNDGFTSGREYITDTDPTNSASFFHISDISHASPLAVWFQSSTGRLYTLYGASNLVDGIWTNIPGQGPRYGAGGSDWMQDTNSAPAWFFRLNVNLP